MPTGYLPAPWVDANNVIVNPTSSPVPLPQMLFGLNQSWQDLHVSRAVSTVYTNSTPNTITVLISLQAPAAGITVSLVLNGVVIPIAQSQTVTAHLLVTFPVPAGQTYEINPSATETIVGWTELR